MPARACIGAVGSALRGGRLSGAAVADAIPPWVPVRLDGTAWVAALFITGGSRAESADVIYELPLLCVLNVQACQLPGPDEDPYPPVALLAGAALFLDFDGTLVAIADTPDAIIVDDELETLMRGLAEVLDGRIAILSGRSLDEIDRLLARGRFSVAGSHGLELRYPGGLRVVPDRPAVLNAVLAEMRDLRHTFPDLVIEEKPFGAALHYRQAPAAENACRALTARLAESEGLCLQAGKMVFEIRAVGFDKGAALAALMQHPAMEHARPIFIGDDETDEAAFRVAADLGGTGILVGPARPTAAYYRLPDVAATRLWLKRAAAALA